MPRKDKERQIKWNKFKTDRYREWQTKYPGLKQQTYISFETAKKIGLPLKKGDTREQDNKTFNQYYHRPSHIGPCIREHWYTDKAKKNQRKQKAKQKKQNSDRNRNFVSRYKKLVGCILCGWNKCTWGLHFDHINPHDKTRDISKMMGAGRSELKKEIRKCRLICANCHSIHTQQQHLSKKYGWHLGEGTKEVTAPTQLELKL